MRPTSKRDLSQQAGNPTHGIQQHYHELMAITDPDELRQAAIDVVTPYVGKSMSQANFRKFMMNLDRSAQRGVTDIQRFISNFLLSGSGLGVSESAVAAIAGLITEDIDDAVQLTEHQQQLKLMVESYGFNVVVL